MRGLGIGARLFLAFLAITALSLSSGVVSWVILRDLSATQDRMTTQALPAVAAAMGTAQATARLVATAPALSAARSEAERREQDAALAALADQIARSVAQARAAAVDPAQIAALSVSLDRLVANVAQQNRLVQDRLALQHRFDLRAQATLTAATAIVDLSETLVSNASAGASAVIAGLYALIDDPARRDQAYDALDRLIEQDIFLLDRRWELRLRASQIGLLVNRLTRAADATEVAEIAGGYHDHLRVIRRRVASIDDPVRRAQAGAMLQVVQDAAGPAPLADSLFAQRLRLIAIAQGLDQVAADNRELSAAVSRVAGDMLAQAQAFANITATQADRAVGTGLTALVAASLAAVLLSGLIVWRYVERGVVRRLAGLAQAMQRLTNGDLTVRVQDEQARELQALASAVRAFRDESLQRRALEQEREATNEELRRHREELQDLVDARTAQLRDEVTRHAQARAKAEDASRAKSEFLAIMSHEIRTPMTGMLGMVRILAESELGAEQRHQIAVTQRSGEALLGILNSILDYSKIELGRIDLDPVPFSLRQTLQGVVDLMRPAAAERGLPLTLVCDRRLATAYLGDEGKLRQIVFNLVSNAIKFTETGAITLRARRLDDPGPGHGVEISVTDTGIGIQAADQDRIFDSFTQTESTITRRFGGTGLGLAISRRFAAILGGTLGVRSAPGQGSTFTLGLTLAPVRRRAPPAPPRQPARHVLVVEDDPATRLVAQGFLRSLGHRVTLACDGHAALQAATCDRPDIVLMDLSLPGIDGVETARRLRAALGPLPVVAMSAHVFKGEVARHLADGLDGYVAKPLTPESLARALDQTPQPLDQASLAIDLDRLGAEMVGRILDVTAQTLPDHFARMQDQLAAGDFAALAQTAHATRSAAAAAGFSALLDSATRLERAAQMLDPAACRPLLDGCAGQFAEAMAQARAATLNSAAPQRNTLRHARSG